MAAAAASAAAATRTTTAATRTTTTAAATRTTTTAAATRTTTTAAAAATRTTTTAAAAATRTATAAARTTTTAAAARTTRSATAAAGATGSATAATRTTTAATRATGTTTTAAATRTTTAATRTTGTTTTAAATRTTTAATRTTGTTTATRTAGTATTTAATGTTTATATATARTTGPTATATRTAVTAAPATTAVATIATTAFRSLRGGLVHDREVGAGVALGHDLALIDPALDADAAERRAGLVEAVIDVGTKRVQRDATIRVALGARHFSAAETTGDLNLDALGARAHRARQRTLHRPAERHAVLKLLGDRLRDEARVELGALDLKDVDLDLLASDPVQVTPELVDLGAGLADHDAWPCRVDVDLHLGGVLADRDVGQPSMRQAADDVLPDQRVLVQVVGEVSLVEPVRLPIVDVAHADRLGMNFLTHEWFS